MRVEIHENIGWFEPEEENLKHLKYQPKLLASKFYFIFIKLCGVDA